MKLHFENLSIFFKKSKRTHMLGPPPTGPLFNFVRFSMTTLPPPFCTPQRTYFLNDPHQNELRKKECFCNICIAINSNLFDKSRTQDNVKCHIQDEES